MAFTRNKGNVGPVISTASRDHIVECISKAVSPDGGSGELLLDGRQWAERRPGTWVGPTVILLKRRDKEALSEEIFGPVLMVVKVCVCVCITRAGGGMCTHCLLVRQSLDGGVVSL